MHIVTCKAPPQRDERQAGDSLKGQLSGPFLSSQGRAVTFSRVRDRIDVRGSCLAVSVPSVPQR